MALTTTNGMSIDGLDAAPNGPGLVQQLGNQVDQFYGGNVASAGALPASGKFPGQRVWLVDVKGWAEWNGTAWVADTAWTTASLSNSWTAFDDGSTWFVPAYRRKNGETRLRGLMKTGTSATTVFSLPTGFRPSRKHQFLSSANLGARSALIEVSANGVVQVAAYGTGADNGSVSLAGIRFEAEI